MDRDRRRRASSSAVSPRSSPCACAASTSPTYTPHVDCGDHVIVINADKVVLTGRKLRAEDLLPPHRLSRRHQGTHRRASSSTGKFPERVRREGRRAHAARAARWAAASSATCASITGAEHPHEAQQPETLDVAAMNRKNVQERLIMAETHARRLDRPRPGRPSRRRRPSARPRRRSSTPRAAPMPPASARTPSPASGSSRAPARSPSTAATSKSISPVRCCA